MKYTNTHESNDYCSNHKKACVIHVTFAQLQVCYQVIDSIILKKSWNTSNICLYEAYQFSFGTLLTADVWTTWNRPNKTVIWKCYLGRKIILNFVNISNSFECSCFCYLLNSSLYNGNRGVLVSVHLLWLPK